MENLIRTVKVVELFGLYNYVLPKNEKGLQDAAILYGDNGVGKSTLLRLVFHLLSAAGDQGHRGSLVTVPYRLLEVELTSGIVLRATRKTKELDAPEVVLTILRRSKVLAEWDFSSSKKSAAERLASSAIEIGEGSTENKVNIRKTADGKYYVIIDDGVLKKKSYPRGEAAYLIELRKHVPSVFLLNAERRLNGDGVSEPSDEMELRRALRYDEPRRLYDLVIRSREIALTQALGTAGKWISRQAVQGANKGSTNVHGVYVNVLKHLVAPAKKSAEPIDTVDPEKLLHRISVIESKSAQLAKYELTPALSVTEFRRALQVGTKSKKALAANLLRPYVESLEGRLAALEPIYVIVDDFVSMVNGFLNDKAISFSFGSGFKITNRLGGDLGSGQLSSGEQQLLLLFCYVLVSRDNSSVFIIDEPEISLNVKWQRKIVQSLLDLTRGAQIQFIFASHSMELIAQHRSRVVKLEPGNVPG